MTEQPNQRLYYWEQPRFVPRSRGGSGELPSGEDLAALRRGINQGPGTVPSMWRFYKTWWDSDERPWRLDAEHYTLTLFAIHQQSQSYFVHRAAIPIGKTMRSLHSSSRFEEAAVDRRFFAALTATDMSDVVYHLRGLLRQTHSLNIPTPLDYTRLCRDLAGWGDLDRRNVIRRHWGLAYTSTADDHSVNIIPKISSEGDQ